MKPLLLALLPFLAQGQQRAADFFERIEFAPANPDADEERKVLEILSKREHWMGAFRTIEGKFGAFPDGLVVRVDFTLSGLEAGWGAGHEAEGKVRFNLKVLGNIRRKTDEIEVKGKETQARGGKVVYKVPPAKIDRLVYHELTHVLQREFKAPDWFLEGMAQYISEDPNNLYRFALSNKPVEDIDSPGADPHDAYARGHLFWKWLETRGVVKKLVDLTVFQRKDWKESLEDATGLPWAILLIAEKAWSAGEIQKYKVK